MIHPEIVVLHENLNTIETFKNSIITRWVDNIDVLQVLSSKDIDINEFREHYAGNVMEYFIDVIKGKQQIGYCPTINDLLLFFEAKNITVSELYLICIHFRESMINEMIRQNLFTETLHSAICYLFNANFKGVLQMHTDTIMKAREEKNEFQNLIENSLNEIYIFEKESLRFSYVNRGALLNSGYTATELKQMTPLDIKPYYTLEQFQELITPLLKHEQEQIIFETVHERKDGSLYDVDIRLQLMNFGGRESFVAIINDITKRVQAIKEKENYYQMATHDYLTNSNNRQNFDTLFQSEAKRAQRYNHPLSIILFDIDDFKRINDTYGHDVGDTVLVNISNRTKLCLRNSDIFARWGGEEFIILLPHADLNIAILKAEEIRAIFDSEPIDKVGRVTCSFGVAQVSDYEDLNQVFKDADDALYGAKESGKNRVNASIKLL